MILERMSEEEFERLSRLIEPQIPKVENRTGLPRKFIREVLIASAFLLAREHNKTPLSLDQYIAKHCSRISSDLGVNLYDVRDVVDSWVIELVSSQTGKEDRM